jgi:putative methyltransferase (TIGR04325 family)
MLVWEIRAMAKRLAIGKLLDFAATFRSPCRGVYETREEALQAIPRGREIGYGHSEMASLYLEWTDKVRASDYPVLFWIKSAISEASSVFDLGGNIGLEFYSFAKYLHYPAHLRWTVCDLPEITRFGAQLAQQRSAKSLSFTESYSDADGADILLTAGTLSFLETDLSSILSKLHRKPKHLLVNRVPLYDGKTFYTVRNLPPIMAVYRIFNRKDFVESILASGYRLVDSWDIPEGICVIPRRPDRGVRAYTGLYFRSNAA